MFNMFWSKLKIFNVFCPKFGKTCNHDGALVWFSSVLSRSHFLHPQFSDKETYKDNFKYKKDKFKYKKDKFKYKDKTRFNFLHPQVQLPTSINSSYNCSQRHRLSFCLET